MAEVVIVESADAAGEVAADAIEHLVRSNPRAVLGLATGSTPLTTWRALAQRDLDLSQVRGFALDEYVGLPPGHPESYRSVITREVVEPLGLTPSLVRVPADRGPIETAGADYEAAIVEAGGVDLQILGIGGTGHIGFNEPGSSFASRTRIKTLTPQTRADNARYFDDPELVPRHALTQGLGTILEARHLILLAFGAGKAHAVALALEGPLSPMVPASAVHLHPHVTVIVDEAAAAELTQLDFYRYVFENKPAGQGV